MPTRKEKGTLDDLLLFAIDPNMDRQLFLRLLDHFTGGKKTLNDFPKFSLQLYKSLLGAQEFNKSFLDYLIKNEPVLLKAEDLKKELIDTIIDWLVISTQTVAVTFSGQRDEHENRARYYLQVLNQLLDSDPKMLSLILEKPKPFEAKGKKYPRKGLTDLVEVAHQFSTDSAFVQVLNFFLKRIQPMTFEESSLVFVRGSSLLSELIKI
jgi:hypothetical protein